MRSFCSIRRVSLPAIVTIVALSVVFQHASPAFAQLQKTVAMLKGEVANTEGDKIAGVTVAVYLGTEKITTTRSTSEGKFSAIVQPGTTYRVTFTHPSYMFDEQSVVVPPSDKYEEVSLKASLRVLRDGQAFTIGQPVFAQKSTTISEASKAQLDEIITVMKHNPKVSLTITVYPDMPIKGKKDAKQEQLTLGRASAITSWLLANGISEQNFSISRSTMVPVGRFPMTIVPPPTKKKKKVKPIEVLIPQYVEIIAHLS